MTAKVKPLTRMQQRDLYLMSAAIVKGLIEHKDGKRFFGSTMSYTHHFEIAVEQGLVFKNKRVTKKGKEWYDRCLKQLPQGRQVFWDEIGVPYEAS